MLLVESALKGYAIEASDGPIGSVSDFLFDDKTWILRWLVVDTGNWLVGRKVLIHPSAVGEADYVERTLPVRLTRAQVKGSPDIAHDQPVSRQMESNLYNNYGWDPLWGGGGYFGGYPVGMGWPISRSRIRGQTALLDAHDPELRSEDGDPRLRSMAAVNGYHIQATDGSIGHVQDFIFDDATWSIRYLIVDTRNWWPGKHVLVSPYAVQEIDWNGQEVRLDLTRERIKASPPWEPAAAIEEDYAKRLHGYYGWPGYGW